MVRRPAAWREKVPADLVRGGGDHSRRRRDRRPQQRFVTATLRHALREGFTRTRKYRDARGQVRVTPFADGSKELRIEFAS